MNFTPPKIIIVLDNYSHATMIAIQTPGLLNSVADKGARNKLMTVITAGLSCLQEKYLDIFFDSVIGLHFKDIN